MSSCYLLDVHIISEWVSSEDMLLLGALVCLKFYLSNSTSLVNSLTLSGKGQPRVSSETHFHFASYAMYFQMIHYGGITP
ncbi:uncharacterized protein Bfra_001962 [Botrytis fragariae]|uniref:Uncharacterized protein n=1 Tax=Botrytis fragariae TaxID=1964551 RepID=A0A8H6B1X3_9HELO|nr:uncharacterized protein Bfra_001962 [Botrytis fragariae]KAF5877595.1 hypothetical protein Bfra_001962 [Botrytis fragariae]